jgi:hypothetical protein
MIHFSRALDIKRAGSRLIREGELATLLFKSIPELMHFSFVKTQEYDDNNYFDSTRLTEVNGHPYSYDGYDDEEDEETTSDLPRIENVHMVEHVMDMIAEDRYHSDEEVVVKREDYEESEDEEERSPEKTYLASYLSGTELPVSFFLENDPKWAVYYALDHGRFDEEAEFKILARPGEMHLALEYARHVIRGRLPHEVENFYILADEEDDRRSLKTYVEEFRN